jgi:CRISPR/Cas system CSM-associated protein Csm2 small subunit
MKKISKINNKKKHIELQIEALERNEKVFLKIGGKVSVNKQSEIDFQKNRLNYLKSLELMNDDEILIEQQRLINTLSDEILIKNKFGIMCGLGKDDIDVIMKLEFIDIALGVV